MFPSQRSALTRAWPLVSLIAAAAASTTPAAAVTAADELTPPVTLVAAYAYDEGAGPTAADASVNYNTATVSGTTWSTTCKFGNCLAFDGTSSFAESADTAALTPGTEATFEAWVFLSAAPGETASLFNKWSQTANDEYLFGINPARTLYFAWHTTGGNTWPSVSFNSVNSMGTIPLSTLTHIAVVRSGATLTFYINGTLDASLTVMDTNPFRNGINTLRVGGQGRGARNRFFNGVIDEARIYNRALTQADIQNDMNTPLGPAAPDTTPPAISITAPAAGATVAGTSTVSATATDNVSIVGVQFQLDGAHLGAEDLAPPYAITWNTTAANGSHTLTAVARDAAGNQTPSVAVSVVVANDATSPVNLVAAYTYDEGAGPTAADASVNYNTATVSGTTWSTTCTFGNCLAFNGTSSFAESADIDALTPGTEATFEAWVFLSAAPGETASLFNKWSQTADDEYLFGINPARTLYFAWHTTGGNTWPSVSFNSVNSTGTIPLNTLTHIAVVRSGATLTFYINGILDASFTVMDTNPFRNGINTLRVGGQGRGARNRFFNGVIDEARIYNRALTQVDIQNDMNTPIGPAAPDTTPPGISSVAASSITTSAATITWTTNEASDSQVEYGLTTAYGSTSALDASLATSHAMTLSGLTSGTLYHVRVRSRDAAGNLALSGDVTVLTLDGTPPAVSITAPAAGATIAGTTTVSATATDNVGLVGVQFRLDGAQLGTEDTTAPYSVSWNSTTAANGSHSLMAVARDAAGNQTTSAVVSVTVANDFTPPVIASVAASAIAASGATISWTTDEPSDSQVEYGLTTAYGSASVLDASPVTAHAITVGGLASATLYHLRVRSRDAAGNLALSGDLTVTTLDDTPPAVSITAPAAGATVAGTVTATTDATDNVGVVGVQFYLDGAPLGAEDTTNTYSVSWNSTTTANGSHTLTAVARDAAGNQTTSAVVSVTVANDLTPPVIASLATSAITASGATISWTTDEASDSQVEYGLTTAYGSTSALDTNLVTPHAIILNGLNSATLYHVRVRSQDAAGNLALSGDLTVTTLDDTPPAIALTTPAAGTTVSGTTTVSADATDNVGVVGVQFYLDGAPLGAEDTTNTYSVAWNSTTAANGSRTLTAVARDAAGNHTTTPVLSVTVANASSSPINLVAAYAYDEGAGTTAADASGSSNTATVSGTIWSTPCKFGNCLTFNGTSSFVEASDIDALTPGVEATFEAWVFLTAAPGETVSVFNKWSQSADDEYLFGINPARTLYFAWHTTGGNTWSSVAFNSVNSTGTIPLNTLTHIAVVRSGAALTFYINGNLDASINVMDTNPFRNGINTLRVGGQGRGGKNRFFNGRIDEVRIYNRTLTQGEIQNDMNTAIGPDATPPVLSTILASAVTSLGATISWTTNEASDSQVNYGLTTAYGSASPLNGSLVTAHWAILGGLTPNSVYHYRVWSRDAAGNLAQSGDVTFTTLVVDLTPPTISITAPGANATVSGLSTVSVTATDNDGVVGVQFKLDGANLGVEDTVAPYTIAWDTTTASPGPHTLTAVAWDAAGNQTTSTAITATVANPQVALAWGANTEANLAGYNVYAGDASGVYTMSFDAGDTTTYTVTGLQTGHLYYFAVTAYDQNASEGGFSNEVSTTTP